MWWTCVVMSCAGFVSGSIMYSYFLPKWIYHVDVRDFDEHNPGSSNAILAVGKGLGLVCMFLDVFKAFAPVFASVMVFGVTGLFLIPVMTAPVLGHAFSPFLRFKGGKAVSVSFGSLLGVITVSSALGILIITMLIVKFVIVVHPDSAKVITAFIATAMMVWVADSALGTKIATSLITIVVCIKHAMNPNRDELGIYVGPLGVKYEERRFRLTRKTREDSIEL
ncbi:hypothetical protein AGMMS49992_05320 [Clostridia bacterium]|nr:hypothetical protein AGMMS49992_05320 [Clostridia bacterium]